MNGMKRGKEIVDKLKVTHPNLVFPYRDQFVNAMAAWLQAANLEKNLAQCDGAKNCPTAAKIGICGAVLNVEQATFLEESLELILKGRMSATAAELNKFDTMKTPFRGDQAIPTPPHPTPIQPTPTNPTPANPTPAQPTPVAPQPKPSVSENPIKPPQQKKPTTSVVIPPKRLTTPTQTVKNPIKVPTLVSRPTKVTTRPTSIQAQKATQGFLIKNNRGEIIGYKSKSGSYYSISR